MDQQLMSWLWQNALGVIPIVCVAAILCRVFPMRAATRHAIWTGVLVAFLLPPLLSLHGMPTVPTLEEYTLSQSILQSAPLQPESRPAAQPPVIALKAPAKQSNAPRASLQESPGIIEHIVGNPGAARSTSQSITSEDATPIDAPSVWPYSETSTTLEARAGTPLVSSPRRAQKTINDPDSLKTSPAARQADRKRAVTPSESESVQAAVTERSAWSRWQAYLLSIRDNIVHMPPIPIAIWIGGACLVMLVGTWRVVRFKWALRASELAPADVQHQVAQLASQLGLRAAPRAVLLPDRVTPMIWCGVKPVLVLPCKLWGELDAPGRASVIQHELAHLRRRDHWVCWLESLVGVLYWWHPVAWWVRCKVRDEADLSCDAWVTALLPQYRRAYAEALVSTRRSISLPGRTLPSVGLGATRVRAKRFSRRLLMIMTTRSRPSLSIPGIALALALTVSASITSPMWACPPEEQESETMVPKASDKSTFEQYMENAGESDLGYEAKAALEEALRALDDLDIDFDFDFDDMEDMMESLEDALQELVEHTAQLGKNAEQYIDTDALNRLSHAVSTLYARMAPEPSNKPRAPRAARPPREPRAPRAPQASPTPGYAPTSDTPCDIVVQLPYELFECEDKTQALVQIMVRDDVPTLVSLGEGVIVVHGNSATQSAFAGFVAAISEGSESRAYALPEGKLEDVFNLMKLSNVPIFVSLGDGAIVVQGTALEHKAFADFMQIINPGTVGQAHAEGRVRAEGHSKGRAESRTKGHTKKRTKAHADGHARSDRHDHVDQLLSQADRMRADADRMRADADRMMQHGERSLERKRGRYESQAHALRERAEHRAHSIRQKYESRGESTEHKAEQLYEEAQRLHEQAEQYRAELDPLHNELAALAAEIETLEGDIDDNLADAMERLESQIERAASKAASYDDKAIQKRAIAEKLFESMQGLEEELEALEENLEAELEQAMIELEASMEQLETEAQVIEEQAQAIAEQAEALEEQAEDIEEQVEFEADQEDEDDDPVA